MTMDWLSDDRGSRIVVGIRVANVMKTGTLLVVDLLIVAATDAAAQSAWTDLGYFNINGAIQTGDSRFTQTLREPIYGEEATYNLTHEFSGGGMFDFSFGGRVWSNFAAGLAVTAFNTTSSLTLNGTVPHPLFFDRPRTVTSQQDVLDHRQLGYHVQLSWFVPVNDKLDVALFGGPSFFSVDQQLATQVTVAESGEPFDTVTVSQVVTQKASESGTGGNVGVDVTYLFTDVIGGGVMLRWASGTVDLTTADGPQSIDVGGFQVGFGARVRF